MESQWLLDKGPERLSKIHWKVFTEAHHQRGTGSKPPKPNHLRGLIPWTRSRSHPYQILVPTSAIERLGMLITSRELPAFLEVLDGTSFLEEDIGNDGYQFLLDWRGLGYRSLSPLTWRSLSPVLGLFDGLFWAAGHLNGNQTNHDRPQPNWWLLQPAFANLPSVFKLRIHRCPIMGLPFPQGHQLLVIWPWTPFSFDRLEVLGDSANLFFCSCRQTACARMFWKSFRLAASVKILPSSPTTSVTSGWPMVIVPVLSNTTVWIFCTSWKGRSILMRTPILALRPVPTMRAVGVAKPELYGRAIARDRDCIEHGLLKRCSQKHGPNPEKVAIAKSSLLEQRYLKSYPSSLEWSWLDWAILTKATICDKKGPHYRLSALKRMVPLLLMVEPMTASPADFHRRGFTCHHRLINGRCFLHNGPIDAIFPRTNPNQVTNVDIFSRHFDAVPITENLGCFCLQIQQLSTTLEAFLRIRSSKDLPKRTREDKARAFKVYWLTSKRANTYRHRLPRVPELPRYPYWHGVS